MWVLLEAMRIDGDSGMRLCNQGVAPSAAPETRRQALVDGFTRAHRQAHVVAGMRRNFDGSVTTPGGYRISRGDGGTWSITEPGGRRHVIGPGGQLNPDGAASIILGDGTKVSVASGALDVQHGRALGSIDLTGASPTTVQLGGKAFDAASSDGRLYVLADGHRFLDGGTLAAVGPDGTVNHDDVGRVSQAAQTSLDDAFENEPILHYQGFMVDVSEIDTDPTRSSDIAHIEKQLDTVLASELPESVVDFMRTVPMTVHQEPAPHNPSTPALYQHETGERSGEVWLKPAQMKDDEPVLLHELLHAFNDQQLPGGMENPTIASFYEQAKSLYPADSYMLKNQKEYFAMTASAYINGGIDRPPFTRDTVIAKQPEYAAFLAGLFGPH